MRANGDGGSQRWWGDHANIESLAATQMMACLHVCNGVWMGLTFSTTLRKGGCTWRPNSMQVCLRRSSDKRQLTATLCVSRSPEVVCMHIITRGKTARSHADIPLGCLLHDAVYQDRSEKDVYTKATFEHLLRKLAEKARHIREQHDLPENSLLIIIMERVTSHSQEALTRIKGHVHQCRNQSAEYISFGRKKRSHI